ncbi:MAG: hypothetical protein ABL996_18565 [Micropepsaceae bacterium]
MSRLDVITVELWTAKDQLRILIALNHDLVRAAKDADPATAAPFRAQIGSLDAQIAELKTTIEGLEREREALAPGK